jgi:hypothetical protein
LSFWFYIPDLVMMSKGCWWDNDNNNNNSNNDHLLSVSYILDIILFL